MSTDFLFINPSFIRGMASVANLSGKVVANESDSSVEADTKAIAADWEMVGEDLVGAMNVYAEQ